MRRPGEAGPSPPAATAAVVGASGKTAAAIEYQRKAIAVCQSDDLKPQLEAALKKYEDSAAKPK